MRRLVLLPLVLLLGVSTVPPRTPSTPLGTEQRQTFVVQADLGRGRAEIASAVLVENDGSALTIATTASIVALRKPLLILDESRAAFYRVIDERVSPTSGIAYLRLVQQAHFIVEPPRMAAPYAGEPVWIWGHPDTGYWVMSTGTVVATRDGTLRVSCPTCANGDGGAGVFDGFGQLVGVLNGAHQRDANGGEAPLLLSISSSTLIEREAAFDSVAAHP